MDLFQKYSFLCPPSVLHHPAPSSSLLQSLLSLFPPSPLQVSLHPSSKAGSCERGVSNLHFSGEVSANKGVKTTDLEWSCCIITSSPVSWGKWRREAPRLWILEVWGIASLGSERLTVNSNLSFRQIWWQILAGQPKRDLSILARSSWVLSLHKSSYSLRLILRVVRWVTGDCLTEKLHVILFLSQPRNS